MAEYRNFTQRTRGPLLGALLRRPVGEIRRRILQRLAGAGFDDIRAAHLNVFQYPGPRGLRPSELAATAGATKQAMNHLLGELESRGYLRRRPLAGARGTVIAMTARGTAAVEEIRRAVALVEAEWATNLGTERLRTLRSLLRDLNAMLDRDGGARSRRVR